jgi:hypothetical protein
MKPFQELTYLGRVRRIRRLAQAALAAYGIAEARFKLLRQAGNTLFRVYIPGLPAAKTAEGLFEEGQYLLRVHEPGYQQPDAIELELAWLAAMRQDAGLPVPEPVPTLDGRLLLPISLPGIPGIRNCSLLRWVKGRLLKQRFWPHHLRAQGRLMARLHNFAADGSHRQVSPICHLNSWRANRLTFSLGKVDRQRFQRRQPGTRPRSVAQSRYHEGLCPGSRSCRGYDGHRHYNGSPG